MQNNSNPWIFALLDPLPLHYILKTPVNYKVIDRAERYNYDTKFVFIGVDATILDIFFTEVNPAFIKQQETDTVWLGIPAGCQNY